MVTIDWALVALWIPNVSKMSIVTFLLTLRRLEIEAVSSSFTADLIRWGRYPLMEAAAPGAGIVDVGGGVCWSPSSVFCDSSVAFTSSEGFSSWMIGISSLGPPKRTIQSS